MFSATWPENVHKLARSYCGDKPIHINIGDPVKNLIYSVNQNIQQEFQFCDARATLQQKVQKMINLLQIGAVHQYGIRNEDVIFRQIFQTKLFFRVLKNIFASTKSIVDQVTASLVKKGVKAAGFHGSKEQVQRNKIIQEFKSGTLEMVVATDVASRGLDIDNIACIFNFTLPGDLQSYVHRIGRTGRAGKSGKAISFFTPQNLVLAPQLIKLMRVSGQKIPEQLIAYEKVYLGTLDGNHQVEKEAKQVENKKDKQIKKDKQVEKISQVKKQLSINHHHHHHQQKNQDTIQNDKDQVGQLNTNDQNINIIKPQEEGNQPATLLNHRKLNDLFKEGTNCQKVLTMSKLQSNKSKKRKKINFK